MSRGRIVSSALLLLAMLYGAPAAAQEERAKEVVRTWYRLAIELVRHTPTYSPPVASRAFAYMGVAGYEAVASGRDGFASLAGQLNEFEPLPPRPEGTEIDDAVAIEAALAASARVLFANTGPTGQRAIEAIERRLGETASEGVDPATVSASEAYGRAVAEHVLAWSQGDGGGVVENMGFPAAYTPRDHPSAWVPTSLIAQQQAPLLPGWGKNRPFAMPEGNACPLPPPPAYSEEPGSEFYEEAHEVYATVNALSDEERAIARFWSDDPMLSPTPPGHWISIAMQVMTEDEADLVTHVDALARLGIVLADSFIGCWHSKFEYDLIRPITYINRVIDPKWQPILNTPPFPEYPSGHSTQSGAAAQVLTALFGQQRAFEDATHVDDGLPVRSYESFHAAAEEAAISRLYGGIHFRAAIERGIAQGHCIGDFTNRLETGS